MGLVAFERCSGFNGTFAGDLAERKFPKMMQKLYKNASNADGFHLLGGIKQYIFSYFFLKC